MATARTIRRFTEEPVDDVTLARCLEAARWAPSGANAQRWRFVVLRSPESRAAVARAAALALDVIEPVYGMSRPEPDDDSRAARTNRATYELHDRAGEYTSVLFAQMHFPTASELLLGGSIFPAMQNFLLAARALGLGACMTSWASYGGEAILREAVGVPDDWLLAGHIVIGWPRGHHGVVRRRPLANAVSLPPADDDPEIDVAAEAAGSEGFRLRAFLRPYRRPLLVGFALIVVDTLLTLAGPFLVQQGLNEGVQHHAESALWAASALFLGTTLVDWFVTWAYTRYTGRTAERLLFALRIRIFSHLQRLALDYYDRELSGRIMTRMTTDVDAFAQLLQTGLITALVNVLSFVGVLVVLSLISWPLTLGVLVLVPPLVLATIWFGRRSARAYAHARETISTVNAEFQESISGVREAQAYVQEGRAVDSFQATARRYLDARLRTQVLQAIYFPFILFLAVCGDAIVLGLGSALVHDGTIAAGTVIAFLLYLDQFFAPVQQLSQVFDQWQQAVASMTKINELMQTEVTTPDAVDPVVPDRLRGALRFDDVRFSYPATARETLHGVDLDVAPGETVALVGETGAGKSTLVKLVARFYDADSGRVLVDGVPITDLDLRAYRRTLGYVAQEAFLFSGTVRDNIAYGRPDASDAEVERAARAVGAHEFIAGLRGGYLHPVTERGRSLSAGQRQLLCLARALLVDPAILLLDEATANLDLSTEARVQRAMGVVSRNRTTLLIAHRLQTARTADRIVVVDDGRIAETGTPDDLLERGGAYAELWNRSLDSSISRYAASRPS